MKPFILILFLAALLKDVTGQPIEKSSKEFKFKGDLNCFYKEIYSAQERNKFYPFNIADTIKLISFRYHFNNAVIKGDSVVTDSLIETVLLSKFEIDTLTDILYNNFYKRKVNYGMMSSCFSPRNAILFLDRFGNLKESVIICFHCEEYETNSDKVNLGDACSQKIEMLRQFFIGRGLKFGTDLTIDLYPGEHYGDESVVRPLQD